MKRSQLVVNNLLEKIVSGINYDDLPNEWNNFDLSSFSDTIKLWDFQQTSLKNSIKCLYLYFHECGGSKDLFYKKFVSPHIDLQTESKFDLDLSKFNIQYFDLIHSFYQLKDQAIPFKNLINRQAFWMATGSGKSLIIIKLIDIFYQLMEINLIPKRDILFLTYREDLIDQFKTHIDKFNRLHADKRFAIELYSLNDYENVKRDRFIQYMDVQTVFYYRSDLFRDEQKEKIVDFRNYENDGNWYIFLDEAHKGDKEDSKMQLIFSILSRNGYLNNFSATFVDPRDILTTIYNFNLEKFISNGYGKHIFMFKQDLDSFKNKSEYNDHEKQVTILKTLIILTYNKLCKESLAKIDESLYYSPLMLVLVNTVNFSQIKNEEGDLKIFFNEIEKVASGNIDPDLFNNAIKELKNDINQSSFIYEKQGIEIDKVRLESISPKTILSKIFNADKPGKIEILILPGNDKEILMKMKTSDKNFALIKIGDAKSWVVKNLQNYEINENYTHNSAFNQLESLDNINILMGSRAFYEGWDSTRPNIILYINIGSSQESKKFVLQSIGRGVRIAPLPNKRRRLKFILSELKGDSSHLKINENIYAPLETLFVMGTNSKVLSEVITTLKVEDDITEVVSLQINELAKLRPLFIPTYIDDSILMIAKQNPTRMRISQTDLEYVKSIFSKLDDRIILCKYNILPNQLNLIKKSLEPFNIQTYYEYKDEDIHPELLIPKILTHFNTYLKSMNEFKELDGEIIHFKNIKTNFNDITEFQEFLAKLDNIINNDQVFSEKYDDISMEKLSSHYYVPLLITENEKIDSISHIIRVKSEVEFLNSLKKFISKNEINKSFGIDWWLFCKIDEFLDKVSIPYYDPDNNNIRNFYPDFIFWIKKGKKYHIVFVDPKGTIFTDYIKKINGYAQMFCQDGSVKAFNHSGLEIYVHLYLYNPHLENVPAEYKRYWISNPRNIFEV